MTKRVYIPKRFSASSQETIDRANQIIAEYDRLGFDLTLRQLYYQFVSRDWLANKDTEYKRLGSIINDARLAGQISWRAIVDRTRNLRGLSHWDNPQSIMQSAASSFRVDRWQTQANYIEVWIEKDALVGVIEDICNRWDVPYFSCRGYTSQSEMWSAAMRIARKQQNGKQPYIIHLGDHDPSGIDMTRDIFGRLEMFITKELGRSALQVNRIALTIEQVTEYNPPPNPTKQTDSRSTGYEAEYGEECWELDALNPTVMSDLIGTTIGDLVDLEAWEEIEKGEALQREYLQGAAEHWNDVVGMLRDEFEIGSTEGDDDEGA
jgi:hypothetical protein